MPAKTSFAPSNINYIFILAAMNPRNNDLFGLFTKYSKALDWDWLLTFSQKKKISGIFLDSLDATEITERLPRKTQTTLHQILEKAIERQKRAYNTLNRIVTAFAREQVPVLVLKGSIFAEELYDNPGIRPFHDIDLLVHKRFLKKAEDVLIRSEQFHLPGKKVLKSNDLEIEILLVDVSEQAIERPKKSKDATTVAKRNNIRKKHK